MYATKLKPYSMFFRDALVPAVFDTLGKMENPNVFTPRVNVKETDVAFDLAFSLPGMEKEQVKIELKDNTLIVSGEKKMEKEENAKYHKVEHHYGSFSRSFTMPENVNTNEIKAEFKNGILTVTLPKAEMPQPKNIEIK